MKTVIKDTAYIPMDASAPRVSRGDIVIESGRILKAGGTYQPAQSDRVIDGSRSLALPGLVNAHTHIAMSLLRNCADDLDLFTWLQDHIWPREAKLTEEDIRSGSLLALAELIRSGVTTFADMYFYQEPTIESVLASGISAHIGATLMGGKEETDKRMKDHEALISSWHNAEDGRIRVDIAPHAVYTCSEYTLKAAAELADEYRTALHIHLSETRKEQQDSLQTHGMTPLGYLHSLGFFKAHCYAAHGVYLSEEDISLGRDLQIPVVHNPTSNLKLANGTAPVAEFLRKGLTVALGTDGASSNNNLNMVEEMHIASLIHKGAAEDPTVLPAYDVLYMATMGGAEALGRADEIGSIEPGKRADIILFDIDSPHLVPLNNPVSAVVYSAQSSDIHTVISSGEVIMENRNILTLDEEKILADARVSADRLAPVT